MKHQISRYFFALILLSLGLSVQAQTNSFSVASTIGVTTPILDNGIGLHIGINPSYVLSPNLSMEGQISYLYTSIGATFLSGKEGNSNALNVLAGGRWYLSPAEPTKRFYLNLLLGVNYNTEEVNEVKNDGELSFGYSAGAFYEFNQFLIGLSYDTPQNIVLQVGCVFK